MFDVFIVYLESDLVSVFKVVDVFFMFIFLGEVIIKVIVMGFVMYLGVYF